jgi:hypothetical protein
MPSRSPERRCEAGESRESMPLDENGLALDALLRTSSERAAVR